MPRTLASARRNYALSALIAARAIREARKARAKGSPAVTAVVIAHQVANAKTSDAAVAEMLAEQDIEAAAQETLDLLQFSTSAPDFQRMLEQVEADWQFDRLVESVVQDAGRAAESVAVATRDRVGWVRHLTLPSCERCAVLAGKFYRWSDGFLRHPGCDCTMVPVADNDASMVYDVAELAAQGQITGLSKADIRAINDGADFGQVANVKRRAAGLLEAGHALTRGGRPTPAGIYRLASDQAQAIALLRRYRYIT